MVQFVVLDFVGLVGLDGSPSYDMTTTVAQPNGCVGGRESRQETAIENEGSRTDGVICWK